MSSPKSKLTKEQRYRRDKMAAIYGLYQGLGIDSSLWYLRDSLNFKFRDNLSTTRKWSERSGGLQPWKAKDNVYPQREELWSYNNPFYRYILRGNQSPPKGIGRFEEWSYAFANSRGVGGAFLVRKQSMIPNTSIYFKGSKTVVYDGPMFILDVWSSSPVKPPSFDTSATPVSFLNGLGATAISRILPNNPSSNLSTFLGELREGLPSVSLLSIYQERTRNLVQNAGGEYLNLAFGWKPLVNDLRGFAKQVKHAHKTLEQYLKDAEKKINRSYHFDPVVSVSVFDGVRFTTGSSITDYTLLEGKVQRSESIERWVEAAFRYHIPGGSSALEKMKHQADQADVLLGLDLTPEVLWNLSPWSWMLDWIGNVGDIMTNISNLGHDGMVMQYAYIMEHRTVQDHMVGAKFGAAGLATLDVSYETKRRHPASPYGFGLRYEDLTPQQQAILLALGMSRAPR